MSAATFDGVDAERHAATALDAITLQRQQWHREHRRPAALTAREALAALRFEALVVFLVAQDVAAGRVPSVEDLQRLLVAMTRIDQIAREAA